jgi:hypothetical protein
MRPHDVDDAVVGVSHFEQCQAEILVVALHQQVTWSTGCPNNGTAAISIGVTWNV